MQTHEVHNNSMAPQTVGAIALHPTGISQGGYYFYSLGYGKRISQYSWTEFPMPVEVEKHVEELAKNGKRTSHIGRG